MPRFDITYTVAEARLVEVKYIQRVTASSQQEAEAAVLTNHPENGISMGPVHTSILAPGTKVPEAEVRVMDICDFPAL